MLDGGFTKEEISRWTGVYGMVASTLGSVTSSSRSNMKRATTQVSSMRIVLSMDGFSSSSRKARPTAFRLPARQRTDGRSEGFRPLATKTERRMRTS